MNKSLIPITVVAVSAAAFVGCEWGGVHSGESWNDAYSWANFTGTYKLVSEIPVEDTSSSSTESVATSLSSSDVNASAKFSVSQSANSVSVNGLKTPIKAGSMSVSCDNGWSFTDDGNGNLVYGGSGSGFSGTVNYVNGSFSLKFGSMHEAFSGYANYVYTLSSSSSTTTTTSSGGSKTVVTPFRWLNLNQKGNLLTIEMVSADSKSATFSGKITGASCPKADDGGYVQAGHIRFTFEATRAANPKQTLTGSISGDWSGASSVTTGTIANRTIDATFHDGKTALPFQAVSGSTTVYAKEISAAAGRTE